MKQAVSVDAAAATHQPQCHISCTKFPVTRAEAISSTTRESCYNVSLINLQLRRYRERKAADPRARDRAREEWASGARLAMTSRADAASHAAKAKAAEDRQASLIAAKQKAAQAAAVAAAMPVASTADDAASRVAKAGAAADRRAQLSAVEKAAQAAAAAAMPVKEPAVEATAMAGAAAAAVHQQAKLTGEEARAPAAAPATATDAAAAAAEQGGAAFVRPHVSDSTRHPTVSSQNAQLEQQEWDRRAVVAAAQAAARQDAEAAEAAVQPEAEDLKQAAQRANDDPAGQEMQLLKALDAI